jgi:hypothetical protein
VAGIAFAPAGMYFVDFKGKDVIITLVIVAHSTGLGGLGDRRRQSQRSVIAACMAVVAPLPMPGRMLPVNFLPAGLSTRFMTEPAFTHAGAVYKLPSVVIQVRHRLPVILQDRIGMTEAAVKLLFCVLPMQLFFLSAT